MTTEIIKNQKVWISEICTEGETQMQKGCQALAGHGGRCRFNAMESGLCTTHSKVENVELATFPEVVKFVIQLDISEEFEARHSSLVKKMLVSARLKNRKMKEDAETAGRSAHRYDKKRADSGVPVLNDAKTWTKGVILSSTAKEIQEAGYRLTDIVLSGNIEDKDAERQRQPYRGKKPQKGIPRKRAPERLILTFSIGGSSSVSAPENLIRDVLKQPRDVIVWDNPPRVFEDGESEGRIQTVNASPPHKKQGELHRTKFANGLWEVWEKM